MARIKVINLRVENYQEFSVINEERPRISWSFEGLEKRWGQHAYEISLCCDHPSKTKTYLVVSSQSLYIPWPFRRLESRELVTLQVRAQSQDLAWTSWSAPLHIEVGLLKSTDWHCTLIQPSTDRDLSKSVQPVRFREEFHLKEAPQQARLYITAHGLYESFVNGTRIGDHVLAPGWTSYDHQLSHQTFDILAQLKSGENVIAAEVAEGWYCGRLGFGGGERNIWGASIGLFAQILITYNDGSTEVVGIDSSWKWSNDPLLQAEIYDGELYDSRLEDPGWNEPRFTFHGFRYVQITGYDFDEVDLNNFHAVVIHTDMLRTGWFECSDDTLNKLHENVVWSMRGNFISVPTDCPQRDERLGWTGDLQATGVGFGVWEYPKNTTRMVTQACEDSKPIIVVSIHYRLHFLGFLACQDLVDEAAKLNKDPCNFALYDQRLAFQWVQKFISGFGGDINRITAFGESAGSSSLAFHLTSNVPLFDRAILQSGTASAISPKAIATKEEDRDDPQRLEKLRAVPTAKIVEAASSINKAAFSPLADKSFFPIIPNYLSHAKMISECSWVNAVITGDTVFEGYLFAHNLMDVRPEVFYQQVEDALGAENAKRVLQSGKKQYRCILSLRNPFPGSFYSNILGHHFIELIYQFMTFMERLPLQRQRDVCVGFVRRWTAFAHGEEPWSEYT
ncbi:alpha-L-rhamnosidase [Fusarium subglutinans]|uniref:Alpha-L-rhamnosidase n=1 Tax=Gibberella subglutinans TaxID=42677 RepID=A0A8H5PBE3_GIBSU|nr:alpha-L-rhamnosidase [Fusarium subglutinans]KAF5593504.1 alpha-L-rhamnosidase [Fusarium subglutinans]